MLDYSVSVVVDALDAGGAEELVRDSLSGAFAGVSLAGNIKEVVPFGVSRKYRAFEVVVLLKSPITCKSNIASYVEDLLPVIAECWIEKVS